MYLDYAELQAERQNPMRMANWVERLDTFLTFNDYEILDNPGRIKASVAKVLAEKEYKTFRPKQDKAFKSDFDKLVDKMKRKGKK
jgi:hypothetical protein